MVGRGATYIDGHGGGALDDEHDSLNKQPMRQIRTASVSDPDSRRYIVARSHGGK